MGQRLVVSLIQDGKKVASVYYHWSAYFINTIGELYLLSQDILNAEKENKNVLLSIVEGLESRGGGLDHGFSDSDYEDEKKAASKLISVRNFKFSVDRNRGLINFSKRGMTFAKEWSNGDAVINLNTHEIWNDVLMDDQGYTFKGYHILEYDDDDKKFGYGTIRKYAINDPMRPIDPKDPYGIICPVNTQKFTCESVSQIVKFLGMIK